MFPHHPDHPAQSLGKAQPKCVLLRWSGRRRSGKCLIPYAFRQRGCYPKDFLWHVEHPKTLLGSISLDTNFPSPALLSLMCLFSVWQRSDRGSYPLTRAKAAGGGAKPILLQASPNSPCWCLALLTHLCPFLLLGRAAKWVRREKALQSCSSYQGHLLPRLAMV